MKFCTKHGTYQDGWAMCPQCHGYHAGDIIRLNPPCPRCAELEKENGRLREGIVRLYSTIEKDAVSGVGNAGYYIRIMASMDGGNFLRHASNDEGKEGG